MIITRTPLRISLGGGGTDLPSYYEKFGSTFISAAIDKYIYITYHRSDFDPRIRLRYSKMEEVDRVSDVQHGIIKETLKLAGVKDHIELTSHAEIPSGTGLGSSGSFGVGILKAIIPVLSKKELAVGSTHIQMINLKKPIGVQDQFVASFGGVNVYRVEQGGEVDILPLKTDVEKLDNNLVLFYTGFRREADDILKDQVVNHILLEESLHKTQELCYNTIDALEKEDFRKYGEIMNEHWEYKKQRSPQMTNPDIDKWYKKALNNGAIGGKLVGAGGGGFLLFYTEEKERLIKALPLKHIPFKFNWEGTKIIND